MCVGGRPTLYRPEFAQLARNYCLLGATKERLGDLLGVSSRTIDNWLVDIPEFKKAVQWGRNEADAEVADNLYRLAVGYEHEVERPVVCGGKIHIVRYKKCYPPEPKACETWLRNRRPQNWGGRRRPRKEKEVAAFKAPQAANENEVPRSAAEEKQEAVTVRQSAVVNPAMASEVPDTEVIQCADRPNSDASRALAGSVAPGLADQPRIVGSMTAEGPCTTCSPAQVSRPATLVHRARRRGECRPQGGGWRYFAR